MNQTGAQPNGRTKLAGVRLGARERALLTQAPRYSAIAGLPIDAPEGTRSAQQGYLRAAHKLEKVDLLVCERIPHATRAIDPRLLDPLYRRGRFWLRSDPTRLQVVWRIYCWATPFGEGVRLVYRRELGGGRPIRWTEKRVSAAERYAMFNPRDSRLHRAALEELSARSLQDPSEGRVRLIEHWPDAVQSAEDYQRWRLAVRVAKSWRPTLGSAALWEVTVGEFETPSAPQELWDQAQTALGRAEQDELAPSLRYRPLQSPFEKPQARSDQMRADGRGAA